MHTIFRSGKLKGRGHLEDLGINDMVELKLVRDCGLDSSHPR